MVTGLDLFRDRFKAFANSFMRNAGLHSQSAGGLLAVLKRAFL